MNGREPSLILAGVGLAAAVAGPAALLPPTATVPVLVALTAALVLARLGAPRAGLLALGIGAFLGPAQITLVPGVSLLWFAVSVSGHLVLVRLLLSWNRAPPISSRRATAAAAALLVGAVAVLSLLASVPAVETLVTGHRFHATAPVVLAAAGAVAATLLVPSELEASLIRP